MRKNNTNKLKSASESHAKEKPRQRSTLSKRVSNGMPMRKRGYGIPKIRPGNSTWIRALEDNPKMGDLYQKAIDLRQADRFEEAAATMEEAVKKFPQFSPLWWYLGGIYLHDLKKPRKAIPCFRRATEISPKSERASLGLFHGLWDAGEIGEAFKEIKRYQLLTNWTCPDYLEIVDEISEKWQDSPKSKKKAKTKR